MCEINPKHQAHFVLQAFTAIPMSEVEFREKVMKKLIDMEIELNKDGAFRFHIHEVGST